MKPHLLDTEKSMSRFVIVVCDALRPDAVVASQMPKLARFRDSHVHFGRHRSVFPSDTRANAATFVTGWTCDGHGINGNAFLIPSAPGPLAVDTGSSVALEAANRALADRLFLKPTLAQILARHGRRLAVISSASAGTTRLLRGFDETNEVVCVSCHNRTLSTPGPLLDAIEADLGAPVPETTPDLAAVAYGVDAFLRHVWPSVRPDCTVIWLNEPDVSYHAYGPGVAAAYDALRQLDDQLGRIVDWWEASRVSEDTHLLIASDHGQMAVGCPIDVISVLRDAGFDALAASSGPAAFQVVVGGFGQIYARDVEQLTGLVEFLETQEWIELMIGSRALGGKLLPAEALMYANVRTADVVFTLRPATNTSTGFYATAAVNAGMHGGASTLEMTAFLAAGGRQFSAKGRVDAPTSTADILPTILEGLGIFHAGKLIGRPLGGASRAVEPWREETVFAAGSASRQILRRFRVGRHLYVDHAWRERR